MENIPRKVEKELKKAATHKPLKRVKNWTLLFINDYGKSIAIRRVELIFAFVCILFSLATASVACLLFFLQQSMVENQNLKRNLEETVENANNIADEKDQLIARLVLLEAQIDPRNLHQQQQDNRQPPTPSSSSLASEHRPRTMRSSSGSKTAQKEKSVNTATAEQNPTDDQETDLNPVPSDPSLSSEASRFSVSIENFNLYQVSGTDVWKVKFRIRNVSPQSKIVSGHVFVVLKPDNDNPKTWISAPVSDFTGGKPNKPEIGQFFSIARYKTEKFTFKDLKSIDNIHEGTIYIYDPTGMLIYEKNVTI